MFQNTQILVLDQPEAFLPPHQIACEVAFMERTITEVTRCVFLSTSFGTHINQMGAKHYSMMRVTVHSPTPRSVQLFKPSNHQPE